MQYSNGANASVPADSLSDAILNGFAHGTTKEGVDFWSDLAEKAEQNLVEVH